MKELVNKILNEREKIEDVYFINLGIPEEEINSFIEFSFAKNPLALRYAKAENISGFLFQLEEPSKNFIEKLKKAKGQPKTYEKTFTFLFLFYFYRFLFPRIRFWESNFRAKYRTFGRFGDKY